jgi:hypothetical protein
MPARRGGAQYACRIQPARGRLRIGPCVGSCGSAAYKREPVFATDIASDLHWANYVELAAKFRLGACCSTPVFPAIVRCLELLRCTCRTLCAKRLQSLGDVGL